METSSIPYHWVRALQPELKELDTIPLTGNAPIFPWDQLSERLAHSFDRESLVIQPGELTWRAKDHLFEGIGDDPFPLNFTIPSLRGKASWIMPEQEMTTLETLLLTKESHPVSFQDRVLSESFYRFLALEVLYNLTQVTFDKTLTPLLSIETELPSQDSLCLDISLTLNEQVIWGRLIISNELRQSWVEHFASSKAQSPLTQELIEMVDVVAQIQVGQVNLNLQQWMNVQLGDLIVLDQCSLEPGDFEGRAMLTLHGKPIFRSKIKDGKLKILELPILSEVAAPMVKYSPEDNDDQDFSDLDLTEDQELTQETDETELTETDDFDLDDDLFENEETEKSSNLDKPSAAVASSKAPSPQTQTSQPITPEKIPVTLTVEAGRIQMTMDQLLKLEPGNLLDLNLHPEDGVDLAINGAIVGKGELLKIGELLGVRILQLGK